MAKKKSVEVGTVRCAVRAPSGRKIPAAIPSVTSQRDVPTPKLKLSALVGTRVIFCGDNLEQLKKLPDACVDLIYINPPFNSNRNSQLRSLLGRDQGEARLRRPPRQHASLH